MMDVCKPVGVGFLLSGQRMGIRRKFFDWRTPALPQVVSWLCAEHGESGYVDLSRYILVVPGGKAGRRFQDLLLEATDGRCHPPQVITPESLPELLYEPQRPFASDLTQRLAWAEALRNLSPDSIRVLIRNVPDSDDYDRWLDLGSLLSRHHTELAADGLDFAYVAEHGREVPAFDEQRRWEVLHEAQQKYLTLLDDLGLWDKQTARLVAIQRQECRTEREILLLAAVDLNRAQRNMLDQVADRVTALVHAPESWGDDFDSHGCLLPDRWRDVQIELSTEQVRVAEGPLEQAQAAAYALAALDGRFRADEIIIGVTDDHLIPHLRRQLDLCGVRSRPVSERAMSQTAPALLLDAVADLLELDRVENFAALVRHPDVAAWLSALGTPMDWLTQLDDYVIAHLQPQLGEWLGKEKDNHEVRQAFDRIEDWLRGVRTKELQPLQAWSTPIRELLLTIYSDREFDRDEAAGRSTLQTCRAFEAALQEHERVPESLGAGFTAAEAIRLVLEAVAGGIVPPPVDPEAIELLGWLELPLSDAAVAIVTNFNEGFVPESLNSDLFLPNRLRTQLGIEDNARRYARDAYALQSLLQSRQQLTLIVGRRTAEGDPLKPSRLLFAADPETIAQRVVQFYGSDPEVERVDEPPLPRGLSTQRTAAEFVVPRPQPEASLPEALSVTAFKDYLACPYRFYLGRVLGLTTADDQAEEMDGSDFGNLLHEVLKEFGRSSLNRSTNAEKIAAFLSVELDQQTLRQLGRRRRPAVELQIEQIHRRLQAFAVRQATHVELGWEIKFVEEPRDNAPIALDLGDGRSLNVRGRIDRIDQNRHDGQWRIIDYKTEAKGLTPADVHRKKEDWVDLQLPLYRHLAAPLGVTKNVQLSYFLLPENSEQTRMEVAEWTTTDLDEADDLIREIGRNILDRVFWPPRDSGAVKYDNWQAVCQSTAFDGELLVGDAR
ncbi:MAG: PD-(D/E)XK nuclease family protein [Planctomycetaceae bacterium]